jgi:hypothetical protein
VKREKYFKIPATEDVLTEIAGSNVKCEIEF